LSIRELLKKIAAFVLVIAGIVLGFCCAFILIHFLLKFNHIDISLKPLSSLTSPGKKRFPYQGRVYKPKKFKKTARYLDNKPDLEGIDDVDKLMGMGQKALDAGEYNWAEDVFRRIKTLRPDFPDISWFIGLSAEGEEDERKAKDAFSDYNAQVDRDPQKLMYIADFLMRHKNYKIALEFLEPARMIADSADVHYLAAKCYSHLGDWGQAIQNLKAALEDDKNYPDIYDLLADCYVKTGKIKEAISAYKEAYDVEAKPVFLYRIGVLLSEIGDYSTSKTYLNRYINTEAIPEKVQEAQQLLKSVRINAMRAVPSEVEQQTDFIPSISLMGIMKSDNRCKAFLTVNGAHEEVEEGATVLDEYYVLNISENRIILIRDETYFVLRPI
jgi:tetratricopeptide (TPR) repeat protein